MCILLLPLVAVLVGLVQGHDVVGCGGFVKSRFPVDFTQVEVKLFTKSGVQKYKTDCAPNNGYFLIPLYDKGEYLLKVSPPQGWIFEPSEVALVVDGETDLCSRGEDVNFELLGFSVYGQVVSTELPSGPSGVAVKLTATDDIVRETLTVDEGRFTFEGVVPGRYLLSATHTLWDVKKSAVEVVVVGDSVEAPAGLVVMGFNVKGSVSSGGEPVSMVQFLLYTESKAKLSCSPPKDSQSAACTSMSNQDGEFMFPSLPPGNYTLEPHYHDGHIVFEVQPTVVQFTIYNDSLAIQPVFEVQGFSVSGKVLKAKQGEGMENAKVYINGKMTARTDTEGEYRIFNITSGTYKIQVEAPFLQFDPLDVQISPKAPHIPDITPARYSVCGQVTIPVPPSKTITASFREVQVSSIAPEVKPISSSTDHKGEFCVMLAPGEYKMKVMVSEEESGRGLLLHPPELPVTVKDTPIRSGLEFAQFKATVSGSVSCIESCPEMTVALRREAASEDKGQLLTAEVVSNNSKGSFQLINILPGKVNVFVQYPAWCWEEESVSMVISPETTPPVKFVQTGFVLECTSSHDTALTYSSGNGSETQSEVQLKKGSNKLCLEKPGSYTLKPKSCHKFVSDEYTFTTSSPSPVFLRAVAHVITTTALSPKRTDDMVLRIRSLRMGAAEQLLKTEEPTQVQGETEQWAYHFSFLANPVDELEVTPLSSELMFVPQQRRFTVSDDCPERVPPFEGSQGVIIIGHIQPPLEGVTMVIELEGGDAITTVTNEKGEYRAGPIHGGKEHSVSATLEGYGFNALPDEPYVFTALKLSKIVIQVVGEDEVPLANVLVSLSGANFKSNNFTKEDGRLVYYQLTPGQYYLKPLLREYEFSPSSKVFELQQGHSGDITFTGKRVAFSCSGKVTTLNRQPQEGITVELLAVGGDSCASYSDEVTSDSNGVYRIRSLLPGCEYSVSVKSGGDGSVDHSMPSKRIIKLMNSDVEGGDFIVFYAAKNAFVTGNVVTDQEYLASLKVHVYSTGKILYSVGVDSAGFFDIPPLPVDPKSDYQLVLESNLSPHFYNFTRVETSFVADQDRHITLRFVAKAQPVEDDPARGSFIAIIAAVVVIFILANLETIAVKAERALQSKGAQDSASHGETSKKRTHRR